MVRFTAGCGFALAAALVTFMLGAQPAAAADKIKVAVVSSLGSAPIFVADAKNYFKDESLDVELVRFDSAQPVAVAVAAGDVDFGATGLTGAFFTFADNGVLKLIGAGTWERPGFQGLGLIASNQAWEAGVKTIAALKGHSVAITQVGTALHFSLYLMLKKYDVDLKDVRVLPLQSNPNVASAITGGQADGALLSSGNAFSLINKKSAHLLGWLGDELGEAQGDGIYTSTKDANERPDAVKHFLAAFRKAAQTWDAAFLDKNDTRADQPSAPQMVAIAAKGLGVSEDVVKLGLPYFDPQSRVSIADVQGALDWYYAQGMIKTHLDAKKITDFRYAIEAPATMGGGRSGTASK
ncbi:MAG TPA: ABC transporter substrate-binding protein [Stellaceae bacterium]|jgi:NitT/TauT family transport system substrate-binding protein